MDFSEDFLHYIWRFRRYDAGALECQHRRITVVNTGAYNKDSGPDFSLATVRIGETLWVGDVEIHLRASDWLQHKHQDDPAYNNVILHVVYDNDREIRRNDGTLIPAIALKGFIPVSVLSTYNSLRLSSTYFPCASRISEVDPVIVNNVLSRQLFARLERKNRAVFELLHRLRGDWEETLYRMLAANFGFRVNRQPFEALAEAVPFKLLKRSSSLFQTEAMLFGCSGLLDFAKMGAYPAKLKSEFRHLARKHSLKRLPAGIWKFLRMRPQNFPTLRIAQFAALYREPESFFASVIGADSLPKLRKVFTLHSPDAFWNTHFHFNKETVKVSCALGKDAVDSVIINTVCLFLFVYGRYTDSEQYTNRAVYFLELLGAEDNAIVRVYREAGLEVNSAFASQALLELKKSCCDEKKCVYCSIGITLLKKN